MNKKDIEMLKEKLKMEKEKLTKELESFAIKDKGLEHNWNAQFPNKEKGDKEEEADDATEYENLISLEHSLELKLRDITIALEKIEKDENNKYGICENCNKNIEEKRLSACPEAKLCISCNEK
jgi:RNA polymerase-binding transcription factor DksA